MTCSAIEPFNLPFTGKAPVKAPRDYKIVGTSVPRKDIPAKAAGTHTHMQHIRWPGMWHGRVVRPRGQGSYGDGARVASVDERSIGHIPQARALRRGDFVGVVAPNEWDAVRAARELRVTWETKTTLPGTSGMHAQMRNSKTVDRVVVEKGNVEAALRGAARVVTQSYRGPYQAHAPFAPNCAIADVGGVQAVVMCSTQNLYETRAKVAKVTGVPEDRVSVVYYESSGSFGHSCYDDAAEAAAIMSRLIYKPVRVQFMRADEHGWDNYGPAHFAEVSMGVDAAGKVVAYQYDGWQHGWMVAETSEQLALGTPPAETTGPIAQEMSPLNLGSMYEIPNRLLVNHRVLGIHGYLKGSNLRSPLDISFAFASEQTLDELAYLAGADPYEFRRNNMTDGRWLAVLDAVARASQWQPRKAAAKLSNERVVTGRGIALGTHTSSYAAAVAEIEVNRDTGLRRREAPLWRTRCRIGGKPRVRREPDHGHARAGDESHPQRGSDVRQRERYEPRLGELPHPALRRVPGSDADRRAAARSAVERRWRRGVGSRGGRDRERAVRRDRRAPARIPVDAAARASRAARRLIPLSGGSNRVSRDRRTHARWQLVTATIHPSALPRLRDAVSRAAETQRFIGDLELVRTVLEEKHSSR